MKYPTPAEFQAMTADEFASFWNAFEKLEMIKTAPFAGRWYLGRHDIRDIITLKRHGYKPEPQEKFSQPMSWYWRRGIRPGSRDKKGKRFQSTSQAIIALRHEETAQKNPVKFWKIMVNLGGEMHPGLIPARGPLEADLLAGNVNGYVVSNDPSTDVRPEPMQFVNRRD